MTGTPEWSGFVMRKDTKMTRREVLRRGAAVTAGVALAGLLPTSIRPVYALGTVAVGARELTILSDGAMSLPLSFVLPEQPKEEIETLLEKHGLSADPFKQDCNVTLLKDGDGIALFDAGAGQSFLSSTGKLTAGLQEAGIDPASITDVIFTHAHPDHLWGVLDDFDEIAFPEASFRISQAEWDFWRADDTLEKMPEARKSFVVGARNRFDAIEDKVSFFKPGEEVFPGVEAIDTAGHTEGHIAFAVHGGSDSVVVLGDSITNVAVSFEKPDWRSGSDHDPDRGVATRQALLDRLATDQSRIIGFHLPHPGAGMVERKDNAYRFVAT